ncbi:MAG TPA: cytochrome c-type biogenesis protein CcmH [Bryobacteraceae bacterium]|nr:cytochrome c-type biogenesis protein CcmH [Bryobacteraceae bacterium]
MFRLKLSLAFLLIAASAAVVWAQTEAQIESDEVKRVGTHISCQCGACQENINCMMSAGQCHFCKPARTKIYQMQTSGMTDGQIIQAFIVEYGEKIFRHDPNSYFWVIPYISLGVGGLAVLLILRRVRAHHHPLKPAVAGGAPHVEDDDPTLARYRDAIERDTDKLD